MLIRMLVAYAGGAAFGHGRTRKRRAAGMRTYILTAIGACLAMLLSSYEYEMLNTQWLPAVQELGFKLDASRYGAQVIAGIGFLGAGTIIAAGHRQDSGLTTATGLFATVCIGMAAGAGFIECVVVVLIPVVFFLDYSYTIESYFKRRMRNMTIYVVLDNIENLSLISEAIERNGSMVIDTDIEQMGRGDGTSPEVILNLRLSRAQPSHSTVLSTVAELPWVISVQELIS